MFCLCIGNSNPFVNNPPAIGNTLLQSSLGRPLLITVFSLGCLGILTDNRARLISVIASLANAILPTISGPTEDDVSFDAAPPPTGPRFPDTFHPVPCETDHEPAGAGEAVAGGGGSPGTPADVLSLQSTHRTASRASRSTRSRPTPRIVSNIPAPPTQSRSWFWWVPSWPRSQT